MNEYEKIKKIDEKIKSLEDEKKKLNSNNNLTKRKERTRHLIQLGALAEKYFNLYCFSLEEIEEILKKYSNYNPE